MQLLSDRSKISASACAYIRALAQAVGQDFAAVAEPYFNNMLIITGRANKVHLSLVALLNGSHVLHSCLESAPRR